MGRAVGAAGGSRGEGKDLRWEDWERTAKDLPSTNHIAQAHHVQFLALFSSFFPEFSHPVT